MITMGKDFDRDPLDFYNETAAVRIGLRIRKIRNAKGLSQGSVQTEFRNTKTALENQKQIC